MKIWLIQSVIAPYRVPLFRRIAETPGVQFTLILLSAAFKTRPQWKRPLREFPFRVQVPFGLTLQTGPESEWCVNPFLFFRVLWERPEVVVCGGYSLATLSVALASFLTRTRYVIWTEATLHTDGRIAGARLWLRRWLVRHAGAIVDAGTLAREYVRGLHPETPEDRFFRAFNCVENRHFGSMDRTDRTFFSRKGLPSKNLLFVGALNERKGIPQLLEAYRRLAARAGGAVGLILIGDGELRGEAERFKAAHRLDHLLLEGWVQNEDTARYYILSDAFILLSQVDHNPLVVFEALAAGVPIICSNGACNAIDFIENGTNGYIVSPSDLDEVVERTGEVLHWDAGRRNRCEQFSRERVQQANYPDAARAMIEACHRAARPAGGRENRVRADRSSAGAS